MKKIDTSKFAKDIYQLAMPKLQEINLMTSDEIMFILSLIEQYKPKKILELGVYAGGSSAFILTSIKNTESHLYSVDYNKTLNFENNFPGVGRKNVGWFVHENLKEITDKWTLKTGGLALDFMDEIGGDIDFVLIDTIHFRPGEILDFLMVLPFLKENAVVVFHDTADHYHNMADSKWEFADVNCILLSVLKGEKLVPNIDIIPNIGAIKLDSDIKERAFDIFNLLILDWFYMPYKNDLSKCINYFKRFYSDDLITYLEKGYEFNKKRFEIMRKNEIKNKDIRKLFRYMILSKLPINVFKQKYTNKLSNYKNKFNDKRKVY